MTTAIFIHNLTQWVNLASPCIVTQHMMEKQNHYVSSECAMEDHSVASARNMPDIFDASSIKPGAFLLGWSHLCCDHYISPSLGMKLQGSTGLPASLDQEFVQNSPIRLYSAILVLYDSFWSLDIFCLWLTCFYTAWFQNTQDTLKGKWRTMPAKEPQWSSHQEVSCNLKWPHTKVKSKINLNK